MMKRLVAGLACAVLTACFVEPPPAVSIEAGQGATVTSLHKPVPFRGRIAGGVTAIPVPGTTSVFRVEAAGSGPISHFGKSTVRWVVPSAELDMAGRRIIVQNRQWDATIISANRDTVIWRYTFRSDTIFFSGTGYLEAELDIETIRGTGRFSGISATGVGVIRANVFTQTFNGEFVGSGTP